jgi:hypothetical protein
MSGALEGFNATVGALTNFANVFQGLLNPLTVMGQNFQSMIPTLTQFNTASQTMSAAAGGFHTASANFMEAARLISAIPSTITHTIQGQHTINVVVNVPDLLNTLKAEVVNLAMQQAVDRITADLKSGRILPPQG